MTRGTVAEFQARINVLFRVADGRDLSIEFVVDTGFEGALTLPRHAVNALGLAFLHDITAKLADGASVDTGVFIARILWDEAEIDVAVLAMGDRPLLGTALLQGKRLCADFVEGGEVRIELSQ
jgi:clan AA aspartic protease